MNNAPGIGSTGNFGKQATNYVAGRKAYHYTVIENVLQKLRGFAAEKIIDLGCGPGTASLPLSLYGYAVIGVDADEALIEQARGIGGERVSYEVASIERLPFADCTFDGATSFGSFHWWHNQAGALDSVHRVLKPRAPLVIVNKHDAGDFSTVIRQIAQGFTSEPLPARKKGPDYDPLEILRRDGNRWRPILDRLASHYDEKFTLEELLCQIQSMSVWNCIEEGSRPAALTAMRTHFTPLLKGGFYRRRVTVEVVSALKA